MDDCLFCKIINGDIRSDKIYEDEFTFAFRDINPVAPTHILVIPKVHVSGLNDIKIDDVNIMSKLTLSAQKIIDLEGIKDSGFRFVINSGMDGGQTVFHLHLHILGGRKLKWPPG
jgi:histidine triad (HIT) family protein